MKTKFSKKLISLLLSVLMVVSALPVSAITAQASIGASWQKHLLYGSADGVNTVGGAYYNESQSALEIGSSGKYGTVNVQELFQNTNSSQGFTISLRAKSDSNVADQGRYFTINQSYGYNAMNWNASKNVAYIDLWSTNKIEIASSRNEPNNMSEGSTTATKGAWHIYTVTVANSTVKMYIDGVQKFTINAGGCNYDNFFNQMKNSANTQLIIGGTSWNGDAQFSGYIGQVNLYNKALSAEEVVTDMNDIKKDYNSYNEKVTGFSGSLSNNGTGLTISGSESRWSNNQMNIVNDQQANNTDAGIIRYDISKLKGMTVESAKLNYKVDSWSADTVTTGLTFYYSTSISNTSYINNSETKSTGWSCGSGTTANNSFATGLGFSTSNVLGVVSKGSATSNTQMDIQSALQKAADADASYLYVIVMQSTAGGSGSNSGWSDTKITPANFTIDYSVKRKEYTRAQVASVKRNITDTKLNNAPYQGTMTNTEDGSYSAASLTGGDQMSNVLYSYGVGGNSGFCQRKDNDYWAAGIQFGAVTLLYDGDHDMAFPVNYFINRTQGGWPAYTSYSRQPVSTYADSNLVQLKHIWHGVKSDGAGYVSSTQYGVNIVNSKTASNPAGYDLPATETDYYSNTLYIKPENLTFDNYRAKIEGIQFNFYVNQTNKNETKTGNCTTNTDGTQAIRVINYKPFADAIKNGKEIYNTVKNDENSYCPTDLYNFYNALDKLMSFNPNNYFAYNNNGYAACCNALADLEQYISPASTALKKSDKTYTHSYTNGEAKNAQKHTLHCNDCGEDIEEDCSFTLTNTVDSTCTTTGTKTYTCSKCSGTVTETIPMKEHNWGDWTGEYSSTKHTRQCQDCKVWDEYYLCELVDIEGKDATCTEDGLTVGKVCSVCNKVRTAQETIQASGHSYTGSINSDGKAVYTCEKGDDSYTVQLDAYNAIVAAANEAITNAYLYESVADVETALNENQFDISKVETQTTLDAKTSAITTAVNALVAKTFTVTFKLMVNGNETTVSSEKVLLGATVQLKVPDDVQGDVYKWIYSTGDSDVKYNSNERTISHVVGHDVTIIAYVGQDADITNTYKVTVKGRNNQVTDVQYLAQNSNLGTADLNIQSIVFYSVTGYIVNGQTVGTLAEVTLTQDTIIEPIYSAVGKEFDITPLSDDITINRQSGVYKSYWDQKVTVTAPSATEATAWYIDGQIAGYGSTFTFRCAKACKVSYSNGVDLDATAALNFLDYGNYRNHTITVVGGYSVPENAENVKVGVYLKTVKNPADTTAKIDKETIITNNTAGKKYVTKFTDTNQFVFTTTRSANTPILIGAVVFVEYTVNGVAKTAYSDATTIYGIN